MEPTAAPTLSPEAQEAFELLAGRWTVQREGGALTLIAYRDGWVALFLDGGAEEPVLYLYGAAELKDGKLIIRRAALGADEAEPVDISRLLDGETPPEAPLAVSLPFKIDSENHLLYVGEAKTPFTLEDGAAEDYYAHPGEPDWKKEEE